MGVRSQTISVDRMLRRAQFKVLVEISQMWSGNFRVVKNACAVLGMYSAREDGNFCRSETKRFSGVIRMWGDVILVLSFPVRQKENIGITFGSIADRFGRREAQEEPHSPLFLQEGDRLWFCQENHYGFCRRLP